MFDPETARLARAVIEAASARGWTLATAESCTGGLVCGALTAVPGSSAAVDRGFVTYSNRAKAELLGLNPALIETHGAVSEAVARAMAEGARDRAAVDLAVSVTGVAGPGGGSEEKPVGLVHFGVAGPDGVVHRRESYGDLGREAVRAAAVRTALEMLAAALT